MPKTKATNRPDFRQHIKAESAVTEAELQAHHHEVYHSSWQGTTAIILAVLSIYFLWVPLVDLLLAIMALIFGILGVRTYQKTASIVSIVVAVINTGLSLLAMGILGLLLALLGSALDVDVDGLSDWLDDYGHTSAPTVIYDSSTQFAPSTTGTNRSSRSGSSNQGRSQTQTVEIQPEVIELDGGIQVVPLQLPIGR